MQSKLHANRNACARRTECAGPVRLPPRSSWRVFGPTQEHNDGDADFYRTTSRLNEQYPGWDSRTHHLGGQSVQEEKEGPYQRTLLTERGSEYGLSAKQIQALGLAGMPSPDSVGGLDALSVSSFIVIVDQDPKLPFPFTSDLIHHPSGPSLPDRTDPRTKRRPPSINTPARWRGGGGGGAR